MPTQHSSSGERALLEQIARRELASMRRDRRARRTSQLLAGIAFVMRGLHG
jgi:hypothetical protein